MQHPPDATQACKTCGQDRAITEFPYRSDSKTRRKSCRDCETKARGERKNYGIVFGDALARRKDRNRKRSAEQRRDPRYRAKHIHHDSIQADRKRGLEHDLTVDHIGALISEGCRYCGECDICMTLDRIDNAIGHMLANVVPACYRCNLIRRDMPYDAWMHVVPAIRDARERGLFGEWTGGIWKTQMADTVGIEPTRSITAPTRFPGVPLRPLGHMS